MKKLVALVILLAAAGGGYYYYTTYGKTVEKPTVTQVAISQGNIVEVVQATGTLEALKTVQVGSQVSGTVKNLYADFNSIVHAGDLLAELDPQLLQVQVDIQNANIQRQETDISSQEIQLEDAKRNQVRTKELFEKGLANQQQVEQADLTVKTRSASIESAKKSLVQARANLSQAELNVSYTKIKSPIDGVVVNRIVDIGQTVQASMNTPQFFTIATDLRNLKLTAMVDESEIGKVRKGADVQFTVDAYQGQTFTGTVDAVRLNATTSSNVVTYPVWINAPNPDLRLRPSLTANIRIIVSTAQNATRIPNGALRFRPTTDMYTALGLTPPAPGQGRAGGRNGDAGVAGMAPGAAATPPAPGAAAPAAGANAGPGGRGANAAPPQGGDRAPQGDAAAGGTRQRGNFGQGDPNAAGGRGQGGFGQNGQGGGRGQGGFGGMTPEQRAQLQNASPEERQRLMQQFGVGGRGGNGAGGFGGGRTGGGRGTPANAGPQVALNADKIDELYPALQTRRQTGSVWTWDEPNKKLTEIRVVQGVTDGQFTELVSGDVKVGQQVVTAIVVPMTQAQRNQNNSNLFGNQQRGGGPGFGQGGQGGFGGQPGGGGGGGARGGGGGGRGGD